MSQLPSIALQLPNDKRNVIIHSNSRVVTARRQLPTARCQYPEYWAEVSYPDPVPTACVARLKHASAAQTTSQDGMASGHGRPSNGSLGDKLPQGETPRFSLSRDL
jgi:hypothetical protein